MKVVDVPIDSIRVEERQKRPVGNLKGLVASIEDIGLLHPIVVDTDNTLKVGWRRLQAFQLLERDTIPAHVTDDLDELYQALKAERDENIQREALPPTVIEQRSRELDAAERDAARERQESQAYGRGVTGGSLPQVTGKTRDRVAAAFGISGRTYDHIKDVVDAAEENPIAYGDLLSMMDDKSVHAARRELTKRRKRAAPPFPSDKYRVIYADPPWRYGDSGLDDYGHAERHYPTMSITELCEMGAQLEEITDDDAVLFLWVTSPLLAECFPVIDAWGFKYKTSFVWDKVGHNFGHYNSVRHELLLVCTKGSCMPDASKLFDSVQSIEKSREHSEKPEQFREIIDTLYTHGKRIELFSRTQVPGWEMWGNEPI